MLPCWVYLISRINLFTEFLAFVLALGLGFGAYYGEQQVEVAGELVAADCYGYGPLLLPVADLVAAFRKTPTWD